MTSLSRRIVAIAEALEARALPYGFGGAIALGYHVREPRGTRDIDVNVFVAAGAAADVVRALPRGVAWDDDDVRLLVRDAQRRLFWDDTPVDLFLDNHPFHAETAAHVIDVPFLDRRITVLGASELVVYKVFFNRLRDWGDIEEMLLAGTPDIHRSLGWLVALLGDDERVWRLRDLVADVAARPVPRADEPPGRRLPDRRSQAARRGGAPRGA